VWIEAPETYTPLPSEFEIFRIAQEALANVLRHAHTCNRCAFASNGPPDDATPADDGAGCQADFRRSAQRPANAFSLHATFTRADRIGAA
jgi:nitrate/nitrite-specific signal transduction histidine kinase